MSAQQVVVAIVLASIAGGACASYDDSPSHKDDEATAMDEAPADCARAKTYATLKTTLFKQCAGSECHDSGNVSKVVVFSGEATPYEAVVGVPSKTVKSLSLVTPGRPSHSFLYRKISATHINVCASNLVSATDCGKQMPLNDWFGLPKETTEDTRVWIVCGANR